MKYSNYYYCDKKFTHHAMLQGSVSQRLQYYEVPTTTSSG